MQTRGRGTGGGRWFAAVMRLSSRHHEPLVSHYKKRLLAPLAGRVLEIGPGNGVNTAYYQVGVHWVGYEPNSYLAADIPLRPDWELRQRPFGEPEEGGQEAGSYDAAVATLVLCSVPNPDECLAEIYARLKPGGQFVFVEHVAGPRGSSQRWWQDRLCPCWRWTAGGCHPNRETEAAILRAGFRIEQIDRFELGLGPAGPHIAGCARKP